MRRIELLDPTQSGRSAEHLENKLRDLVVGQDEAIRQIVTAYQTHLAGLSPVGRPIGNFLLLAVYRLWKNSHCRGDPRVAAAGFSIRNQDRLRGVSTRELVLDTEYPLVFNHSTRVYYFGSLAGRLGLKFDPELLYIGALFHDMGLTPQHSSKSDCVDSDCTTHHAGNSTVHASVVALLTNGVEMFSESFTRNSPTLIARRSPPRTRAASTLKASTLKKTSSRPLTTAPSTRLR